MTYRHHRQHQQRSFGRTSAGAATWALLALMGAEPVTTAAEGSPLWAGAERLDRGTVATTQSDGSVFIGWRLLATDPTAAAFRILRRIGTAPPAILGETSAAGPTCFVAPADAAAHPVNGSDDSAAVLYGVARLDPDADNGPNFAPKNEVALWVAATPAEHPYRSIPLRTPDGYRPGDASVGDLDGDGAYEIVIHQVGRARDNSQAGPTTAPILQAYRMDGTFLWEINLGRNIREGAHYTQFMVFDLDGDGRAEVACKTADGTVDGRGTVIGDADADHRNARGYILDGPEFLTVFEGATGATLDTVDYIPPRGRVADWGDDYGNRVDRFLACVARLDGPSARTASLVMGRGYYTRSVLAAWDFRQGKLVHRWTFDSDDGTPGNSSYRGQGNHGIAVADVDADGRDEIVHGSCVIDDDGTGLHSTGLGHGDAMHVTDIDPDRPGLEIFKANGDGRSPAGIQLRDARSGEQLFGVPSTGREGVVRAAALDIDPRHRGLELWGKGRGVEGLFSATGARISDRSPRTCNMGAWWDADLLRELLDGVRITKWDWREEREDPLFDGGDFGCVSINGSKRNPSLCADILGDWREEIVAPSRDGRELRIFSTAIPTPHRLPTLMHDPLYRLSVAWQNVAYNQPAHPGFHLGEPAPRTAPLDRHSD